MIQLVNKTLQVYFMFLHHTVLNELSVVIVIPVSCRFPPFHLAQDPCVPNSRPSCPPELRRCSSSTSCVDVPLSLLLRRPGAGWRIVAYGSIYPCLDRRLVLKHLLSLFPQGSPSIVSMPASRARDRSPSSH